MTFIRAWLLAMLALGMGILIGVAVGLWGERVAERRRRQRCRTVQR